MIFGELIRSKRESKGLLLRQVAAFLEVDTAFVSKMERGERNASREQVLKLANFLGMSETELIKFWIADKIAGTIGDDKEGVGALKLVLKTMTQK